MGWNLFARLFYAMNDHAADKDYGTWFSRFLCRWQGHAAGPIWQNIGGLEPNMKCQGCGEDLG